MGIPLYWRELLKLDKRKQAILPDNKVPDLSTLLIDANAIFHIASGYKNAIGEFKDIERRKSFEKLNREAQESQIIEFTLLLLDQLINFTNPKDVIAIAVDGPVPMAKIQQQRQRRYKVSTDITSEKDYDSNMITPGTLYMQKLDIAIQKHIVEKKNIWAATKIIYSSHQVPGEGEHKLFEMLRNGSIEHEEYEGNHLIYGNDSDLILLALINKNVKNLFIAKDSVPFGTESLKKTPLSKFIGSGNVLNIDKIREIITIDLGKTADINDFVFSMSILGNDFLPRQPSLCNMVYALPKVISTLKNTGHIIGTDGNVLWAKLAKFIDRLNKIEPDGLLDLIDYPESKIYKIEEEKTGHKAFKSKIVNYALKNTNEDGEVEIDTYISNFRSGWYSNALKPRGGIDKHFEFYQDTMIDMALNYIKGLNWVFNYYKNGSNAVTWLWFYPYHYTPLFTDIDTVITAIKPNKVQHIVNVNVVENEIRFNVIHQLVAVMPPSSVRYVPEFIRSLYDSDSVLSDLMVRSVIIDDELIEKEFQSVIILPFANYDRIMNILAQIPTTERMINLYSEKTAITEYSSKTEKILQKKMIRDKPSFNASSRGRGRGRGTFRGRGRG